jgi:hypothetical protein
MAAKGAAPEQETVFNMTLCALPYSGSLVLVRNADGVSCDDGFDEMHCSGLWSEVRFPSEFRTYDWTLRREELIQIAMYAEVVREVTGFVYD